MEQKYVAFFDSGVGGLTVLREFVTRFPSQPCLYLGDNTNAPYGNRPEEEIRRLAMRAFEQIARYPVRGAVIACNTVTAECAEELRRRYPFPIIGVEPAVKPAAAFARGRRVLLLATRATLSSERVRALLRKNESVAEIIPYCPENLAGEIESNIFDLSRVCLSKHLPKGDYAAAVLGCTHYVFLKREISEALSCPVFDGNAGTVDHLANVLNICSDFTSPNRKNITIFLGNDGLFNNKVFSAWGII